MSEKITKEELALINSYAQTELGEDEVFVFSVTLCDDRVDRDMERFSADALEKLSDLFTGTTGIFDHDPKGTAQTARIFRTWVEKDSESGVTALRARAYMVRTASNADLIAEIKGGIKKEVSVSCSCARKICSVCGADRNKNACLHVKGCRYDGETCVHILDEPTDAYEWSFVAVPAQRGAGVTKRAEDADGLTRKTAETDADIRADILRMSYFCKPFISSEAVTSMTSVMNTDQLKSLRLRLRKSMLSDEQRLYSEEKNILPSADDNKNYKI